MRASLFGTYNRGHSANRIYAAAARAAGFDVCEIHVALWEKTRDKDATYFSPLGLLHLAVKWTVAAAKLAWRWRSSGGTPVVIVGFNGQLDLLGQGLEQGFHGLVPLMLLQVLLLPLDD